MLQKFDERNRDLIVNINGELVHRDKAGISPFDSAVQGGDAVWEGLRLYNGRIFKLHEHLDRLERSARALSFAEIPPREKIIGEIKRTLAANKMRDGVHIRLTLTRGIKTTSGMDPRLNQSGPTLVVLAEHKAPVYAKTGLSLITSKIRRPPPDVLDALRRGRMVGILLDQNATRAEGIFAPFFGTPASTSRGLAVIALRTEAPVVPVFIRRLERGRHLIEVGPVVPPPERDVVAFTTSFNEAIEKAIRRAPEQWFWLHKRWKTRPRPEVA